jgi:hypothetical protein
VLNAASKIGDTVSSIRQSFGTWFLTGRYVGLAARVWGIACCHPDNPYNEDD